MTGEEAGIAWKLLVEGPVLRNLWAALSGHDVLRFSRAHAELWTEALELVLCRLRSPTLFALLSRAERGAALRALPAIEDALLFENFSGRWTNPTPGKWLVGPAPPNPCPEGDSRGPGYGQWIVGPGTFVLPRIERHLAGSTRPVGLPLSVRCISIKNEDPLSDLDPSGLVFCFRHEARPRLATFRCRHTAFKPHRCGGVFALAQGLGNDKGPESAAVFIHFLRDPQRRSVHVQGNVIGQWRDGDWCTMQILFDWDQRTVRCRLDSDDPVEMSFKHNQCSGCRYLFLYNQTCDFEASWTDILIA